MSVDWSILHWIRDVLTWLFSASSRLLCRAFLYYIPPLAASQAVGSAGSSRFAAFRAAPCVRPIVSAGRKMRKRNACALLALSVIRGSSRRRSLRKLKSNRAQR